MKKVIRIYEVNPKTHKEESISEPEKIIAAISKPTGTVDLDYFENGSVKMGTSDDLAGETVLVGEIEIEIPKP